MEDEMIFDPEQFEFTEIPSAAELLGINSELYGDSLDQAGELYEDQYGDEATELSEEERRNLTNLRNEFERLSTPIQQKAPIGGFIPGNEFSVSTQGLSQGLNDLFTTIQTEKRKNELFGDPKKAAEISSQISDTKEEVQSVRTMAEKIASGELSLSQIGVNNFIRDEDGNAAESERQQYANIFNRRADKLEREAEELEATMQNYQGVSGRLQDLEERKQEVAEQDQFAEQFKLTFGEGMFNQAQSTIQDRTARRSQELRTIIQQQGAIERMKIQQAEITRRAALRLRDSGSNEFDADEATPNEYQPRPIQATMQSYKSDVDDMIRDIQNNVFVIDAGADVEQVPPRFALQYYQQQGNTERVNEIKEAMDQLPRLANEKMYAERIRLDALQWQDSGFTGNSLPPLRAPSESQTVLLDNLMNSNIPEQAVRAWMFYNRIDLDAPPPVPANARENNDAGSY